MVGVRWYEAVVYCKWLTAETGRLYRLPTEAEREKAARGTNGRIWPWGNTWDPNRCNNPHTIPRETTPVGRYSPGGDSPYGVADMVGNVREWCATKWVDSYRGYEQAEDNDPEGDARRVLRGGVFFINDSGVRCARRLRDSPVSCSSDIGFRVVASPVHL